MKFGISSRPSGDYCANCNKPLDKNNTKEHFCSYCGVPLNQSGLEIRESEYTAVKFETIAEIEARIKSEPLTDVLKDMKTEF